MIVVTTGGNEEFFNSNIMQEILESYLPNPDEIQEQLPENIKEYQKLKDLEWNLSNPNHIGRKIKRGGWKRKKESNDFWVKKAEKLNGKRYQLSAAYIGLFPLMGQVFHNNYTEGIKEIGFDLKEGELILSVLEGGQE